MSVGPTEAVCPRHGAKEKHRWSLQWPARGRQGHLRVSTSSRKAPQRTCLKMALTCIYQY